MDGNRTKHKILKYYFDVVNKAAIKIPPPKILFTEYAAGVSKRSGNKVAAYLLGMNLDGYFTFYPIPDNQLVEITNLGMNAYISGAFIEKNKQLILKYLMNSSITVANIVVAIAAIIALNGNDSDVIQTKVELKTLQEEVKRIKQDITNPNNQHLQNSYPPTQKDTSTHSAHK